MKKKYCWCFVLLLISSFYVQFVSAEEEQFIELPSEYFIYSEWNNNCIRIDKYIGPDDTVNVVIPRIIDGKPVTGIGEKAFYDKTSLTGNLIIPDSVESIGDFAFYNCTGFTGSLVISGEVDSIGKYAFYNCSGLNGGLVLKNGINSISENAFGFCSELTGSLVIPSSVTSIADSAFSHCDGFTGRVGVMRYNPDGTKFETNST